MTRSPPYLPFSKAIKPFLQDCLGGSVRGARSPLPCTVGTHTPEASTAVTTIQRALLSDMEASVFCKFSFTKVKVHKNKKGRWRRTIWHRAQVCSNCWPSFGGLVPDARWRRNGCCQ